MLLTFRADALLEVDGVSLTVMRQVNARRGTGVEIRSEIRAEE